LEGKACAKDEYCENAQCKPGGCEVGTVFCKGNSVYTCDPDGSTLAAECSAEQECVSVIPNAAPDYPYDVNCLPLQCPPGGAGCVQNQIGSCASDGRSLSAVMNDCAASGSVCTAFGTCAANVTDTLGEAENSLALPGSPFVGNLIDVRSARKLTELQMFLVFSTSSDLHWLVLEQVGNELVPRAETMTTNANSSGFVSSGPLSFDYQLEVGKRYALGVMMPSNSIGYNDLEPVVGNPSFGTLIGGMMAYSASSSFGVAQSIMPEAFPYMKVTTESP
jgi:hypothetical protein